MVSGLEIMSTPYTGANSGGTCIVCSDNAGRVVEQIKGYLHLLNSKRR